MRLGRLFGVPVRVNPAALVMAALAMWLGEQRRLWVMSISIVLHELMHIAAARLLHVRVIELELMPMGGAARLENLWRLRPAQSAMVALAGPAGNLLLIIWAAAMCQWGVLDNEWTAMIIEQNLVIFLFNLLPALPMDGGRILCGLLGCRMSAAGAAKVGSHIGQMIAALLLILSAYGLLCGKLNITLPMAALFLLGSVRRERLQAEGAAIESLTGRFEELQQERILPMRWLAAAGDATVRETAVRLRPRYMHVIAVYDDQMQMRRIVSERELISALLRNADAVMDDIGYNVKNVNLKKEQKNVLTN